MMRRGGNGCLRHHHPSGLWLFLLLLLPAFWMVLLESLDGASTTATTTTNNNRHAVLSSLFFCEALMVPLPISVQVRQGKNRNRLPPRMVSHWYHHGRLDTLTKDRRYGREGGRVRFSTTRTTTTTTKTTQLQSSTHPISVATAAVATTVAAKTAMDQSTTATVSSATATTAAATALFQTTRRPSKAVVVAWVLAVLLLRSWWKDVPPWMKQLLLTPWKRFVVVPIQRLYYSTIRQRFWNTTNGRTAADGTTTSSSSWGNDSSVKNNNVDDEDMDSDGGGSSNVLQKIQNVLALAQSATDSVTLGEMLQLQGALMTMLQMVDDDNDDDEDEDDDESRNKMSRQQQMAQLWNEFYQSSGTPLFLEEAETAAAEDDDDDENDPEENKGIMKQPNEKAPTLDDELDDNTTTTSGDTTNISNRTAVITTLIDQLHLSDWAYLVETKEIRDKLRELSEQSHQHGEGRSAIMNWDLVRHVSTNEPGRVGHYLALDSQSKTVLIAVKGTSALSDMITDACGVPARYNMTTTMATTTNTSTISNTNTTTLVSCHEGILDASLALVEDVQPLVEHLFLPAGYKILLVGHSLGAGVACMVGTLLRSRLPQLRQQEVSQSQVPLLQWDEESSHPQQQQQHLPLRVVAFAPPPMLDLESAVATMEFTTTIVNKNDVIPRASLSNLGSLIRFLKILNTRLEEKKTGGTPTPSTTSTTTVRQRLRRLQAKLEQLLSKVLAKKHAANTDNDITATNNKEETKETTNEAIMTPQEIFDGLNEARGDTEEESGTYRMGAMKDMDHLFVPGRVIILYEKSSPSKKVKENKESPAPNEVQGKEEGKKATTTTTKRSLKEKLIQTLKAKVESKEEDKSLNEIIQGNIATIFSDMRMLSSSLSKDMQEKDSGDDNNNDGIGETASGAVVADGAAPVLRHINIHKRMLSDHMPDAYENSLRALL